MQKKNKKISTCIKSSNSHLESIVIVMSFIPHTSITKSITNVISYHKTFEKLNAFSKLQVYSTSYPIYSTYSTSYSYPRTRIVTSPVRITTSPMRIMSSPVRIVSSPVRIVTSPMRVIATPIRTIVSPAVRTRVYHSPISSPRVRVYRDSITPIRVITSPIRTLPSVLRGEKDRIAKRVRTTGFPYKELERYLRSEPFTVRKRQQRLFCIENECFFC